MKKNTLSRIINFAAAFSLPAAEPYGLTHSLLGAVILTIPALTAVGMALLLTCFCRPMHWSNRLLPVAVGWITLAAGNLWLGNFESIYASLLMLALPLAVAFLVMPGCYCLIYLLETWGRRRRFRLLKASL